VLPRGGSFANGRLTLSSSGQQYVKLPAGILGAATQITIETWVTFPDQLPVNCFFFGFGNTNGAEGAGYIFCAPQGGRIAITSTDYTGEQNAYSGVDFSLHTNFHLAAVFNPPAGSLALYTNGVLAASNASVTTPLSAVNDVYSFIGRSLYSADPYPDFILDEFRIYDGVLSAAEIAATQVLGPDQPLSNASPALGVSGTSASSLALAWPLPSAGFTLESSTNLVSGVWTPVAATAQMSGGRWRMTVPVASGAVYFRLRK
jgi:hypothetical protein